MKRLMVAQKGNKTHVLFCLLYVMALVSSEHSIFSMLGKYSSQDSGVGIVLILSRTLLLASLQKLL